MNSNSSSGRNAPNLPSSTPGILENNIFPQRRPVTILTNPEVWVPSQPKKDLQEISKARILPKQSSRKHDLTGTASKTAKYGVSFYDLPQELHNIIAKHCDPEDLLNLSGITKWMRKFCAPLLYRNVDLSLHNRGIVTVNDQVENEIKRMWSDNSACTYLEDRLEHREMEHRQMIFLETLTRHPEYGVYVHKFSWSIQVPETIRLNRFTQKLPSWAKDPVEILQHIWKVFQLLTNVREIDIAWLHESHRFCAYEFSLPLSLFPSATSVSLVGVMPRPFPALILKYISPSNLRHLTLSNLQDCPGSQLSLSALVGRQPTRTRSFLNTLTGHCTSLRTFTLRTVAPAVSHSWDAVLSANSLYTDYAAFIRSVAPTLEKITFEQGPPAFMHCPVDTDACKFHATRWESVSIAEAQQIQAEQNAARAEGKWGARSGGTFRKMDKLFGETVLKEMVEGGKAGEWVCLKEVEIRGVGAWDSAW
ncbi:MAG: hypothetical protein Q9195_004313 [Heterodermia aff. obscurata]